MSGDRVRSAPPLLRLSEVRKVFKLEAGLFAAAGRYVWAVNGVSLDIARGETYGLVGESGSGKTTLARTIVQLVPHTAGSIRFFPAAGEEESWEIGADDAETLRRFRAQVKYVFQDPSSSLDPRMSIYRILTAGARYAPGGSRSQSLLPRAREVIEAVGLRESDLERRPSEFSGGQRQRISLARALYGNPSALICDEVVSALDVSIQGQILNLLVQLKRQFNLTILFIAHDLTVVSYMADRIGVLYGGSLMEEAPAASFVGRPLHPYSQLLYMSIPRFDVAPPERAANVGTAFNATREPAGCPFSGRCPLVQEICRTDKPALRELAPGHRVACHFVG
ncbi:MAG TPA: ABC transporter ATP-binding protein [Spirochaetia bacterium]|nr:ABC transporter ATP-binding protein [Spirochaetia bacterium]